jgi:hypothetical protein
MGFSLGVLLTHAVVNGPSWVDAPSAESISLAIVVQFRRLRVVDEHLVADGLVDRALAAPEVGLGVPRPAENSPM